MALSFPIVRRFAALSTVAAALLTTLPLAAQAQTHVGNGQGLQVNADLVSPLVDISVGSAKAQLPSPAGGSSSVGPSAFVQNVTLVNGATSALDTNVNVNANAVYGTTNGGSGQVLSTAGIATVGTNTPGTNLTLGLQTPLSSATGLSNFLTLRAIRTVTTANGSARSSSTIIEGLAVRNASGSFVTLDNSLLGLGTTGTTTLDGNSNLSFSEASNSVTFTVAGVVNLGNLASITLHDKMTNGDGSRTTNGITVDLGTGFLGGSVVSSNVILASSTAGVSGAAAAPEPGSVALLATPFVTGLAIQVRRRRKMGIMQQN